MRAHGACRIAKQLWILVVVMTVAAAGAVPTVPYVTGFEPDETPGFSLGDLNGQGDGAWTVSEGSAVVQDGTVSRGAQAVEAAEGTVIDVALDGTADVIWVDTFLKTTGSLDAPTIPSEPRSSVLFFSSEDGILALDGDGSGSGTYTTVVGAFPTGEFIRVSIRQDYTTKTYDVWLNGIQFATGLGFKDNSISKLNGAQRRSATTSYLDDFSVTEVGIDADSDEDGLIDLDEVKFYGTDPFNADTDGDRMQDGAEIFAGTDPLNAGDFFDVEIAAAEGGPAVRVRTITGRMYTLQRKNGVSTGTWENIPGFVDVPGDGTTQEYIDTEAVGTRIYRGIVSQP